MGSGREKGEVMTIIRRQASLAVAATFVVALAHQFLTAGPNPRTGEGRPWSDVIAVTALLVVGAAIFFGVLLPLARKSSARAGVISVVTGVAALVGLPVLVWSGSSALLGTAAVLTARQGGENPTRTGTTSARVGIALGAAAIVINIGILAVLSVADFRPALPS